MKKVSVSINNKESFMTTKRFDIENLFSQMCQINNSFHIRPNVSFTVTCNKTNKAVKIDWEYYDKIAEKAYHDNLLHLDELVDAVLLDLI